MRFTSQDKGDVFVIKIDFVPKNTFKQFLDGVDEKIDDILGGFCQVEFFSEVRKGFMLILGEGKLSWHGISPFYIPDRRPFQVPRKQQAIFPHIFHRPCVRLIR
jgi:hypothetical protein